MSWIYIVCSHPFTWGMQVCPLKCTKVFWINLPIWNGLVDHQVCHWKIVSISQPKLWSRSMKIQFLALLRRYHCIIEGSSMHDHNNFLDGLPLSRFQLTLSSLSISSYFSASGSSIPPQTCWQSILRNWRTLELTWMINFPFKKFTKASWFFLKFANQP